MLKTLELKNLGSLGLSQERAGLFHSVIVSLPIYKQDVLTPFNNNKRNTVISKTLSQVIDYATSCLITNGYLFIYGSPAQLIEAYSNIPKTSKFRYWISLDAINEIEESSFSHLKHSHLGILMISNGDKYLPLDTKNTRLPYVACSSCGKNVKDWGGKKHLMNTKGAGLSDVWRDFYKIKSKKKDPDNQNISLNIVDPKESLLKINGKSLPKEVLERLISLVDGYENDILNINVDEKLLPNYSNKKTPSGGIIKVDSSDIKNRVILGDCISEMEKLSKKYPEGVFDLVFADPPYNLKKDYKVYDDGLADQEYIDWCNKWLELCVRLTKPTGSIFILNIPKWALEHAKHLNNFAYLQNWIVWDALSTPKGKIMPAHYSLLYYTKNSSGFTFNKSSMIDHLSYCVRNTCVESRHNGLFGTSYKVELSDFWSDLHRIKHKKDRDDHPCQLPDKLMDRIITTFSKEGDLVFDPFAGAGTTAIRAIKNNRKYTTIEIDPSYKEITEKKLLDVVNNGEVRRQSVTKKVKTLYTKKYLETKAQELSITLGKKPTLKEFLKTYSLDIIGISELYSEPERVLKAGRIGLLNGTV
ncbi:MAG: Site-specific DNA-methyltransferase [Parcubacteria group bacterium]|nr:Site-specific DNA-methyltransferase [Parcubacteria group bacterium]